jgi:excisionase family DNA binding protein
MKVHVVKTAAEIAPYAVGLKDAVAYSGVKMTRLREAIREGKLQALKVGGTYLVRLADLRDWLDRHEYVPDLTKLVNDVLGEL